MPWQNGTFVRRFSADGGRDTLHGPTAWARGKARRYRISGHDMDSRSNDLADGMANFFLKDGTVAPVANIDMCGNKHTGVGASEESGEFVTRGEMYGRNLSAANIVDRNVPERALIADDHGEALGSSESPPDGRVMTYGGDPHIDWLDPDTALPNRQVPPPPVTTSDVVGGYNQVGSLMFVQQWEQYRVNNPPPSYLNIDPGDVVPGRALLPAGVNNNRFIRSTLPGTWRILGVIRQTRSSQFHAPGGYSLAFRIS